MTAIKQRPLAGDDQGGADDDSGVGNSLLTPPGDPLDDIAHHIDGTFVLVVRTTDNRYRRRCFLSAASAQRAARNAQTAGHDAEVYLAELKPLWKLTGEVAS